MGGYIPFTLKEIAQALDIPIGLYEELAGEEGNLEYSFVKGIIQGATGKWRNLSEENSI